MRSVGRNSIIGRFVAAATKRIDSKRVGGLRGRRGERCRHRERPEGARVVGGGGERAEVSRMAEHGVGVERRAGGLGKRLQAGGHERHGVVGGERRGSDVNGTRTEAVGAHGRVVVGRGKRSQGGATVRGRGAVGGQAVDRGVGVGGQVARRVGVGGLAVI